MKSVVFNEKEIESFKKSGVIKYAMLALATPIGLILSCVLAYINIDFLELFFLHHCYCLLYISFEIEKMMRMF